MSFFILYYQRLMKVKLPDTTDMHLNVLDRRQIVALDWLEKLVCWKHITCYDKQNRESTEGCSKSKVRKIMTSSEKGFVSTSRLYASPNGRGRGVRRNKRHLLAYHTPRKCSIMETSQNSVEGRVR